MLVFLDSDGLMVQGSPWKSIENLADGFYTFSAHAVANLQEILFKTHATLMPTTSHKNRFTPKEWKVIFSNRGIDVNSISELQTRKVHSNRKKEILNWHKRHKDIKNFVIIDDDKSLNGLPFELKEKRILTNSSVGLTQSNAVQAIKVLTEKKFSK
jgi:hypothetical protein